MLRSLFNACVRSSAPVSSCKSSSTTLSRSLLHSNANFYPLAPRPLSIMPNITSMAKRYCSSHANQELSSTPLVEEIISSETVSGGPGCDSITTQEIIHLKPMKYIEFNCSVCQERVAKTFSKHSYEKGVVIIKCPGCQNLHLIADNLGFTGYGPGERNVEEMAAARGETIQTTWEGGEIHIKQ